MSLEMSKYIYIVKVCYDDRSQELMSRFQSLEKRQGEIQASLEEKCESNDITFFSDTDAHTLTSYQCYWDGYLI